MVAAKRQAVWMILVILLGLTGLSHARIYHVATNGNDANPGTLSSPLRSIQKAASLAQAGDTVSIRDGVYRETVVPAHSGNPGALIAFTAYNDEKVVLSGGDPVTGWVRHDGDIWRASVPWDAGADGAGNTLFVNGELKFEAREGGDNDPLEFSKWGQIARGRLTPTHFTADDLRGWGDDYWTGAKVRNHRNDWTIATSTIADYDSETGKVTFAVPIGVISQKHILGYTIYDTIKALDQTGEWFKDRTTDTLYYQAVPGQNPNDLETEFKRRNYGFDVRGRAHIRVHNLIFRGVSIRTDSNTSHSLWDGNTFYAYDKADYGRFWISGESNVFRDNEVHQIWGSVASVNGTRHQLVNNYFHDIGYNGTSRVITMSGSEHLVSHNTVRRFARSFLDGFPYRSEFAYNLFEDGARLSWDTGVFDGDAGRGNGGGSIVHHNVFRNTKSIGIYKAFYSGTDLVIHHNIVYNLTPSTLRTGYLNFLKYYHNTVIGAAPRGDVNAGDYAVESNYNNNLQISTDNITSIGVNCRGNHNYDPSDFIDFDGGDFRLATGSGAIDVGIELPGINDGFAGVAPDAGALEYGQSMWKVGHDFLNLPHPDFGWVPLPGTNIFEDGQFSQAPTGWTEIGTPVWFSGNAWNTGGTGLSRIGGRCFQFNPGDGIRRTFNQLKPNTWYTVASEARLVDQRIEAEQFDGSQGEIHSENHRGEEYVLGLGEGEWLQYDNIDFGYGGKYDQLELTYTRPPGTTSGDEDASLEVRSSSPTGQLLGEFRYNPSVVDSWYASRISIPALSGKHTIYLLGKGAEADTLWLATVRLLNTNIPPDHQLTIGVRDAGSSDITTQIGEAFWRLGYESFTFRTGPEATSAELLIQNGGLYDAYLDRLALYEMKNFTVDAAVTGIAVQSSTVDGKGAMMAIDGDPATSAIIDSGGWWQIDLGAYQNLYSIRLMAPASHPDQLGDFRISACDIDPRRGSQILWQRDYFTDGTLSAGETLTIKATDRSMDGVTELQDVYGQFVRVEPLGEGNLGIAEVEVLTYDEDDLVESDGIVCRTTGLWQATFAQVINIGALTLLNSDDPNEGELSSFQVSVWDRDPNDSGQMLWHYLPTGNVERGGRLVIRCDEVGADGITRLGSVLGRAVRVQMNDQNNADSRQLPLADAVVYNMSAAPPVSNFAPRGEATQSSNLYVHSGLAQVAANNIILPRGDFTSTRPEANAWWQVDLKQTPRIEQVVLFNRTDAASRIGNFRVSVWDGPPEKGGSELWGRDYSYSKGDLPAGGSLTINGDVRSGDQRLDEVRGARFVRVQLLGRNILSLAEVQVWASNSLH